MHLAAERASRQDNTMRPGSSGFHRKSQVYDLYNSSEQYSVLPQNEFPSKQPTVEDQVRAS
ncbi:hypothetical protein N7451_002940 [Penicillium sp. IBT 35674x]|nr:hypothetical protein N7451_002940 [Penicillium sp. IBT 35674x]